MGKYILMPDKTETQHLSEGASAFFIQKRVFAFFCHNRQKKVPARHERIPSKRDIKHKGQKALPFPFYPTQTPSLSNFILRSNTQPNQNKHKDNESKTIVPHIDVKG